MTDVVGDAPLNTAEPEWTSRWAATMMPTYAMPSLMLTHGSGCVVKDADGNTYLDLIAGIAVSSLGHGHPAVVAAVSEQVSRLAHTSNLYAHETGIRLAERLTGLLGPDMSFEARVFWCQDGAGANETAYKLARAHGRRSGGPAKSEIIAAEGSFHGRTMGALSITGNVGKREPFTPLPGPVTFVPYGDTEALRGAIGPQTAAVFLEPIQGEAGIVPPPKGYLTWARKLCHEFGALLVIDEVQSGMGRTGEWFVSVAEGVRPDVITVAKGIAGGLPLGACIAVGESASLFRPGDHASTFGGNPVSCSAALAVIDTIEKEDLLSSVRTVGAEWDAAFGSLDHRLLSGSRGRGLWWALLLSEPRAAAVEAAARAEGFLVNCVRPDVIRLAPPLVLTAGEAAEFSEALPSILDAAMGGSR